MLIAVVEEVERLRERRLQAWITTRDVQRVAVVVDVEHLRDGGLRRRTAIVDAKVRHLRETIAEIQRRRHVEHRACRIDKSSLIVLNEVRPLRLHHHTRREVIFVADHSERQFDVVRVVFVFRITAQRRAPIVFVRLFQTIEILVPSPIMGLQTVENALAHV